MEVIIKMAPKPVEIQDPAQAESITKRTGVKPAIIKNTTILRFVKKEDPRYQVISWNDAFKIINRLNLKLVAFGDYLKVFKNTDRKKEE